MAKRYSCRDCEYSFVLASGGIGTADVKTHCGKIMRVEEIDITESEGFKKLTAHDQLIVREYRDTLRAKQGPREPLDELAVLRTRIEQLEAVADAARVYLTNSTPVNAVMLDKVLKQAKGERQG